MADLSEKITNFQIDIFVSARPYIYKIFGLILVMLLPVIVLVPAIHNSIVGAAAAPALQNRYFVRKEQFFTLGIEMFFLALFSRVLDSVRYWPILLIALATSLWVTLIMSYFPIGR